jgi:hypothetical protein
MIIKGESHCFLQRLFSSREPIEQSFYISSGLHRNYAKMVLLVDPDQQCLLVIVEDSAPTRPVIVETSGLRETISFFE